MDFAALPPEVNSARIYSGPGPAPMLAAASAWGGVAAELTTAATSYDAVVVELAGASWLGPASASMAAAAAAYVAWLRGTAGQAELSANQAAAAAAAYEAAFAATVPPPVIAANRAQLMMLVATNLLGQNTSAIAATEALYGEMWAQDATAMFGYAASSAAASRLAPFTPPLQNSNPAGPAGQAVAVAKATGTGAGTQVANLTSAAPQALPGSVSPLQAAPPAIPDFVGLDPLGAVTAAGAALSGSGVGVSAGAWQAATVDSQEILSEQDYLSDEHDEILNAIRQSRTVAPAGLSSAVSGAAPVTGAIGRAVPVGGLSVPSSWVAAAPEIRAVGYALPATSLAAAPTALAGTAGTAFSEMALAGMGGSALAGTVGSARAERAGVAAGRRAKPPQASPASPVTSLANDLREFAALHEEGILTDEEYHEQKRRLLSAAGAVPERPQSLP